MDKPASIDDASLSYFEQNSLDSLNGIPHGVLVFERDQLVFANRAIEQLMGYTPTELQSLSLSTLVDYVHPDDCTRFLRALDAVKTGAITSPVLEMRLLRPDGTHIQVTALLNMILHQGKNAVQVCWLREMTQASSQIEDRRKNTVMHDIMTALAMAADLNQTFEIILVNLREVIHYDRAGLFLLDKDEHFVLANNTVPEGAQSVPARGFSDSIILELRRTKRPLIVRDIQKDERFAGWSEMQSIHGWIGAPLVVGEKITGFLSLGALEIGAYDESDALLVQDFSSQVAAILEKAWLHERSHRRTEDLEVLSRFSVVLGQAEGRQDILTAIMDQITDFFGAVKASFLFPDETETLLQVRFSSDDSLVGLIHPSANDLLWQVFKRGRSSVIRDLVAFIKKQPGKIFIDLFTDMQSAVLIPLRSGESTTGILCFGFDEQRGFTADDLNLYNAIAEIAGASLQRVVMLEALEKQVEIRTQHLSTLYAINDFVGERRELADIFKEVLSITIEAVGNQAGAIYLLNAKGTELNVVTQLNIPARDIPFIQTIHLSESQPGELFHTSFPKILRNADLQTGFPFDLSGNQPPWLNTILTAPIRAKGQPLGLLVSFADLTHTFNEDDILLFGTIADQIGMFVERARLITQAEQSAVIAERQRLARELHDSVTQLLYSQVLFSGASQKVLDQNNLPLTQQYLSRIEKAAQQALKEMRLLVYELRPSDQLDEGLVDALRKRLEAVEKRSGMQTHLITEGDLVLPSAIELSIYRIVQEALNNTLKHAGANTVILSLQKRSDGLEIEVADDGCGFNYDECLSAGGMGLANMLERTASLGGKMQVETSPGTGTRVRITIGALE